MGQFKKLPANLTQTIVEGAGIITDSFDPSTGVIGNILGATTGTLRFNPNPSYEDFAEDINNANNNTWQFKRVKGYDPVISGTYVNVTAALAAELSGAGDFAVGDATRYIPSHMLTASDFADRWFIVDYSDKNSGAANAGYVAIHIKKAMNTTGFQLETDKDKKGNFPFEYHGHYDASEPDDVPYEVIVKAGTNSMGALTVTSEAGTSSGKSKITVSGYTLSQDESYVYMTAAGNAPGVAYGQSLSTWTPLTSGSEITPTSGHTKITVAVRGGDGRAVGSGNATLTIAS